MLTQYAQGLISSAEQAHLREQELLGHQQDRVNAAFAAILTVKRSIIQGSHSGDGEAVAKTLPWSSIEYQDGKWQSLGGWSSDVFLWETLELGRIQGGYVEIWHLLREHPLKVYSTDSPTKLRSRYQDLIWGLNTK